MRASKLKLFLTAFLVTTGVVTIFFYLTRTTDGPGRRSPVGMQLVTDKVFLTSQLEPESVPTLKAHGIRTIVDMRPDGEAPGQPPSSVMAAAAGERGLQFHYIPVPHDTIPDEAVAALQKVFVSEKDAPFLLYCRTGRRAVRLFALAEASRNDGPTCDTLLEMVRAAGFDAADLKDTIDQRIARRAPAPEPLPPAK